MSNALIAEKLDQASKLVAESPFDVWITFVRETAQAGDPVLDFMLDGSLTWISALLIGKNGKRVAVVGNYDAEPLEKAGHWHEIKAYVQDAKPALIEALEELVPAGKPRLAANFSPNDEKADGLSHGMYLLLEEYLKGTRFEGTLESAQDLCCALRGRKTPTEVGRIVEAIMDGDRIFEQLAARAKVGVTEKAIFDYAHELVRERNLGLSWDSRQDPIVNSGPNSMIGHGVPSETITIQPGHIFHIDFGVIKNGYSSDIQRSWFVGAEPTKDALDAFQAVWNAIQAGFKALKPGVRGWEVDDAARKSLVAAGYPEYLHALGHQVGRMAHDGGTVLAPRWPRYGDRPLGQVAEGEVYTLELGVLLEGRGYLGLEEMVRVTSTGCEWLSMPQEELWTLSHDLSAVNP